MRLGRDDVPDGVKSVLSGFSWLLAAVMPVTFAVLLGACTGPKSRCSSVACPMAKRENGSHCLI
jgi:hypothetical protein